MGRASKVCGVLAMAIMAVPASAATVADPTGDFLASYTFAQQPDLDVTNFSVTYDSATSVFTLSATMAGVINPATPGVYVIGVNNGTATNAPFSAIGQPNVVFNQAFQVQKTGTAAIGATPLIASVTGDSFSVLLPLAALNQSGFAPDTYGFNLWPRIGVGGGNAQISDFAPQNALLAPGVPEPASWALMIGGFGVVGTALRRRSKRVARLAPRESRSQAM